MNLVNVTPVMTSDTTPAPYSCSASSVYSSGKAAWKAFDNRTDSHWSSKAHATTSDIILNFGEKTPLYCITARGSKDTGSGSTINKISIYGRNSNDEWVHIKDLSTTISSSNNTTVHTFYLDKQVSYESYKFTVITNRGNNMYMRLSEIKLYQDTDQLQPPSERVKTLVKETILNHELMQGYAIPCECEETSTISTTVYNSVYNAATAALE